MEMQKDFLPSVLRVGLYGGGVLPLLFLPAWLTAFRLSVPADAWLLLAIDLLLTLWWLGTLALLPPTRPLWRSTASGFSRHAAPILAALSIALTACRVVFALLFSLAQPLSEAWGCLFCALAAWGALLFGQGLCMTLLPCFRGRQALGSLGAGVIALWLALDLLRVTR